MSGTLQDGNPIILVIAGRPYPLRVAQQDEASLRRMVQEINDRFNEFQVQYSDRDKQDCLVMTLLTYASDLRAARQAAAAELGGEITQRIQNLELLVDGML